MLNLKNKICKLMFNLVNLICIFVSFFINKKFKNINKKRRRIYTINQINFYFSIKNLNEIDNAQKRGKTT